MCDAIATGPRVHQQSKLAMTALFCNTYASITIIAQVKSLASFATHAIPRSASRRKRGTIRAAIKYLRLSAATEKRPPATT
jgi:hypothetical protein